MNNKGIDLTNDDTCLFVLDYYRSKEVFLKECT